MPKPTTDKERKEKEIDYSYIYGTRVLVFLETDPQSNKYHQVLFTPEMYKNLTQNIGKPTGEMIDSNIAQWEIKTSEEIYDLPDLSEAYSKI